MTAYRGLSHRGSLGGIFSGGATDFVRLRNLSFGPPETIDVDDNEATATKTNVILQEGSSGTTNSVKYIRGGSNGDIMILRCATSITLEYSNLTDGMRLQVQTDYTVTSPNNPIWFVRSDGKWLELYRAVND
jgi:hypothetical protein